MPELDYTPMTEILDVDALKARAQSAESSLRDLQARLEQKSWEGNRVFTDLQRENKRLKDKLTAWRRTIDAAQECIVKKNNIIHNLQAQVSELRRLCDFRAARIAELEHGNGHRPPVEPDMAIVEEDHNA